MVFSCFSAAPREPAEHDKEYLRKNYAYVNAPNGSHLLGQGWHGKVKQAHSVQHNCLVAIKSQPRGRLATGEERLLGALNLPHVVRLFDVAVGPRKRYIVMERGTPLTQNGMLTPPVSLPEAQNIMADVLRGLAELHACGVYHRDVKLANVVRVGHATKIVDLAKAVAQPVALMRPVYERADARGACALFVQLLTPVAPQQAAAFERWYKGVPHLRVRQVMAHPLLGNMFPNSGQPVGANGFSRAMFPAYRGLEKCTAKLPFLRWDGPLSPPAASGPLAAPSP